MAPTNQRLLTLDEMPGWARGNPYILTGYRPICESYRTCIASVASYHNETLNILSHVSLAPPLAPLLLYATLLLATPIGSPDRPTPADVQVFAVFLAGALLCMAFSAAYHTLRSHSRRVAETTKQFDFVGITCPIFGSFVPTIYYAFACDVDVMRMFLTAVCTDVLGAGAPSPSATAPARHVANEC